MARESRDGAEPRRRVRRRRGSALLAAATALAGNRQDGEDLLQAALERVLRKTPPPTTTATPEGYLRRVLYNLAADGWRRRGTWKQKLLPVLRADSDTAAPDPATQVDQRDALVRLLGQLPPRQRAVIVLRYWEQRSETDAALLGCSEGTVKSAAARGLQHLRELSALDDPTELTEKKP